MALILRPRPSILITQTKAVQCEPWRQARLSCSEEGAAYPVVQTGGHAKTKNQRHEKTKNSKVKTVTKKMNKKEKSQKSVTVIGLVSILVSKNLTFGPTY